jgi:hypothetical protein
MSTLTPELRKAVQEADGNPVSVVDLETHQEYVLVRADVYRRLSTLLEGGPLTEEEQQAALRAAGERAGWDDPEMDIYDRLYPRQ